MKGNPDMRSLVALAAVSALGSSLHAEDFVYQGKLSDNGQPADGVYDLTFEYYTVISGGAVQLTATRDDVQVSDGVFQINLPMPPSDDARFLELAVRDGASTGGYTQLLPRTFIASTPYATKALNVEWDRNMSNYLTFGGGDDVVLINRDVTVSDFEYFGIGADTEDFAGMYITTTDSAGEPFYGYATGDIPQGGFNGFFAYHYLSGETGDLIFNVNGFDDFVMRDGGSFEVFSSVRASGFVYNSPRTRSYSIPPAAFKPADMSGGFIPYVAGGPDGAAYIFQSGSTETMVAPVSLPDGATITGISASLRDISTARLIQAQIRRIDQSTGNTLLGVVGTTDPEIFTGVRSSPVTSSARVVDNDQYSYEIWLAVDSTGWINIAGGLSVRWVEIEYTVESPD